MTNQEPIKIIIEDEESYKADRVQSKSRAVVNETGKKLTDAAKQSVQKAWDTDARRTITQRVSEGLDAAVTQGSRAISLKVAETTEKTAREQATAVQSRLQDVDWKTEAQSGLASGLKWISAQLSEMAEKVTTPENNKQEKSPPDNNQTG